VVRSLKNLNPRVVLMNNMLPRGNLKSLNPSKSLVKERRRKRRKRIINLK